ncbi:MAG: hypothetical protein FJY73_13320 [Candidatus Eisenbacteria bacterium]|nr:hypothetical protein [Candidatus Eisenbacteria bacterium]
MAVGVGVVLAIVGWCAAVSADLPGRWEMSGVVPHAEDAVGRNVCPIVYYNICSGYHWAWGWGAPTEEAGVVFDLPAKCDKVPGTECTNLGFWWYWIQTQPGYNYTVTYRLFRTDSQFCKAGSAIGTLARQDPVERWNYYPGLGSTEDDVVVLTASLDWGGRPYLVTDNNQKNQEKGCAPATTVARSMYYGVAWNPYCPPQTFADQLGPVNLLMDPTFSCEETSIEPASWGAIKALFR